MTDEPSLQAMIDEPSLVAMIEQRLEGGNVELPVFDDIALRVHTEVRDDKLDIANLCKILEEDPSLVADLLRMANSSFFSGLNPVNNLHEAAVRLGLKQIAALVLSVSQKKMYSASKGCFHERLTTLWLHSSSASMGARWLARTAGYSNLAEEAYVAGLLHDVGKLSLLSIMEDIILKDHLTLSDDLIDMTLQQLHCEHGAQLIQHWNLPDSFREIVSSQCDDDFNLSNVELCIVRVVDKACLLEGVSDIPLTESNNVNLETLPETRALGLSEIDLAELRLVLEDFKDTKKAA
ncbi:MAG: HDOD domain-containing protein [Granulosicoccus sp.]